MANDANIILPVLEIGAGTGPAGIMALPELFCSGGTGAAALITLPGFVVVAEGNIRANGVIELPNLFVSGYTGMAGSMELPVLSIEGSSISGALCSVSIEFAKLAVSATTSGAITSVVEMSLPGAVVVASSTHSVLANGNLTLISISASGMTTLAGEEVVGYVINPKNLGLSAYEGYDFNSLCVISGKSFGASSSGLYLLEGNTDAGKMIDAEAAFPITDFGVDNKKRLRTLYYGGDGGSNLRFHVIVNEGEERRREFSSSDVKSKTPVSIGRDGRGEYWQVKLSNVRGSTFKLDTIEAYIILQGKK